MDNTTNNSKVLVLGLGGAGGRVVQTLSSLPEAAGLMLAVFDTDRNALENLTALPEECKVLCDTQWLLGQGSGGDSIKGQRALFRESSRLQAVINQADLLIITGGLGFLVLADIYEKRFSFRRFSLQTKVVLSASALFILGGALLSAALVMLYHTALAHMDAK